MHEDTRVCVHQCVQVHANMPQPRARVGGVSFHECARLCANTGGCAQPSASVQECVQGTQCHCDGLGAGAVPHPLCPQCPHPQCASVTPGSVRPPVSPTPLSSSLGAPNPNVVSLPIVPSLGVPIAPPPRYPSPHCSFPAVPLPIIPLSVAPSHCPLPGVPLLTAPTPLSPPPPAPHLLGVPSLCRSLPAPPRAVSQLWLCRRLLWFQCCRHCAPPPDPSALWGPMGM